MKANDIHPSSQNCSSDSEYRKELGSLSASSFSIATASPFLTAGEKLLWTSVFTACKASSACASSAPSSGGCNAGGNESE